MKMHFKPLKSSPNDIKCYITIKAISKYATRLVFSD